MSVAIRIDSIAKHYPSIAGRGTTKAVDDVSLDIKPGELFFLLGPSGCGKTTLLRMIAGFIEPTKGRIFFGERDVTHLAPNKRNTGMVFQSYALWPHMTVGENVAFGLKVRKVPPAERESRIKDALEHVRMGKLIDRKPGQLSGGQQQRVALARALVVKPDLLLLDEPLSNLDAKLRLEMRTEITRICAEAGITTLYVTHDQKEALSMADRAALMRDGRIEQVGTPRELYTRPHSRFVADFLGETNFLVGEARTPEAGTVAIESEFGIFISTTYPPSLEKPLPGVTCSVRPEAWSFVGTTDDHPQNRVNGTVTHTTYLGEAAQHIVEVKGAGRLKVNQVHPTEEIAEGSQVTLAVKPSDVVVLPS